MKPTKKELGTNICPKENKISPFLLLNKKISPIFDTKVSDRTNFILPNTMNKYIIFLLLSMVFTIFACQKNTEMSLSRAKMANILLDAHIAESASVYLSEKQKDSISQIYYQQIYQIHDVSAEDFKRNMDILSKNPAEMQKVYSIIKDSIASKEKQVLAGH